MLYVPEPPSYVYQSVTHSHIYDNLVPTKENHMKKSVNIGNITFVVQQST